MRPARPAALAATLTALIMLTGCGGASDPAGSPQQGSQGSESDRLSISTITKDNRGDACETVLGDYVAFGEHFGIDAAAITRDNWEGAVDLYWNDDDPDEVATAIRCQFDYLPTEFEGLPSTTTIDRGSINIILARTGEEAASLDDDGLRLNGPTGNHIVVEHSVEGDGVLVAAQIGDPTPADEYEPTFTGEDVEAFLTDEALPKIEP